MTVRPTKTADATTTSDESNLSLWDNQTNQINFYEKSCVPQLLEEYAVRGGLADGSDIDIIYSKIQHAKTLLEVGAGYGRVIKCLQERGFKGGITAVEQSRAFFNNLEKDYGNQAKCYHQNILEFNCKQKFEVILWLWSGISDFSIKEQKTALAKLHQLLNKNGQLILDTLRCFETPANASQFDNKHFVIADPNYKLEGYIPSSQEIEKYAYQAGFSKITTIDYLTSMQRKRSIYILER
jgi:hypothetical protein